MHSVDEGGGQAQAPPFELTASRNFLEWMATEQLGLAFTTYLTGKLFLLGVNEQGGLSIFERSFPRPMGVWSDGQTILLCTLYQLWRLENCLEAVQEAGGYDRLYVPRVAHVTGDVDAHDVSLIADGGVVFANTRFSCLSRPSERYSFLPVWKPPFITRLAAEDRCHLNGFAVRDGLPYAATVVAATDVADGWRDRRVNGGVCLHVPDAEPIVTGLSMPHSPRWYRGRLWLVQSGTGELGYVDQEQGRFEPIAFCPGYVRGLAFSGDFAIVALSLPRERKTFGDLPLETALQRRNAEPRCGLMVIHVASGDVLHWIRIEGVVAEIYDVAVLPGVRRPAALGILSDEIQRTFSPGPWAGPPGMT